MKKENNVEKSGQFKMVFFDRRADRSRVVCADLWI